MRRSADWTVVWDDRILEWIRENDGSGTAAEMKHSDLIRIERPSISRRLKKLEEADLVRHVGNGAYLITEKGEGYLDESYDVERGTWLNRDRAEGEGPSTEATGENGV